MSGAREAGRKYSVLSAQKSVNSPGFARLTRLDGPVHGTQLDTSLKVNS